MGEAKVLATITILLVSQTLSVSSQDCSDEWDEAQCIGYRNAPERYCETTAAVQNGCRKTCGRCTVNSGGGGGNQQPQNPQNQICEDIWDLPLCEDYRNQGLCQSVQDVRDSCRRTCRECGQTQPTAAPNPACSDTRSECPQYLSSCNSNQAVREACPVTCGLCAGQPQPGPPGPPGPAPGPSSTCTDPGTVQHAQKARSGYLPAESVRFACDTGFDLMGTNSVVCQSNGQWNAPVPTCQRQVIACRDPGTVDNAQRQGGQVNPNSQTPEYLPGTTVTYTCNSCYTGSRTITCLENGAWEALPVCSLLTCADPGSIQNGRRSGSLSCNSQVIFSCESGYVLQGNPTRTCRPEGRFDGSNPQCVTANCPSLPTIQFGSANRPNAGSFPVGTTVSYSCQNCYNGGGSINCQSNGQWSNQPSCNRAICNDPGNPSNGAREVSAQPESGRFWCGTTITYRCNDRYELRGNNIMQCGTNGQFSGAIPSCVPIVITCGPAPTVQNADRDGNGVNFRDVVTYRCRNCYNGGGTVTCQANSRWTTPPACNLATCRTPAGLANGGASTSGPVSCNTEVTYRCNNGYELRGNPRMVCGSNGQYQGTMPTCAPIIISCGDPGSVQNAQRRGDIFTALARVTYTCNQCYAGGGTVTCESNGQWTRTPSCFRVQCQNAPRITNGRRTGTTWVCGQDVVYSCNAGYELIGNPRIQCAQNGQFSGQPPTCRRIPVNCGDPGQVEGASRSGNDFGEFRTVTYTCAFCYRGSGSITCQSDGRWTAKPQCNRVACAAPDARYNILNGVRTGNDYNCGGRLSYRCNSCHSLVGNSEVTCDSNGQWGSAAPTCQPLSCPDPGQVTNAVRQGAAPFPCGGVVMYNCQPGYRIEGNNGVTCSQNGQSAQWSPRPRCIRIINCGDPGNVVNAERSGSQFTEGGVVNYVCRGSCFSPGGTITCQSNGQWSARPVCRPVTCPPIGGFANGARQGDATSNQCGTVLVHFCNTGYELQGEMTIQCLSSGQWNFPAPTCRPIIIDCGAPPTVANAVISAQTGGTTVNAVATYSCNSCYRGGGAVICSASGRWTTPPACSPVECGNPDAIGFNNGQRAGGSFSCQSTVSYTCNPGFRLEGNPQRTCQGNGAWTGATPVCRQISCPAIPTVPNSQRSGNSNQLNAVITYNCNSCFIGSGTITCLSNGAWSQLPVCRAVNCGNPTAIANGFVSGNNFGCNSRVTYVCNNGYDLRGTASPICQPNAQWSAPAPTCIPRIITCGDPGDIANARRSGSDFNQNAEVQYACNSCFQGGGSRRCQANGQWTVAPVCSPLQCNDPGTPQNGQRQIAPGGILTCNTRIFFTCNNNYQLQGSSQAVCGSNGQWDQPLPTCAPIIVTCRDPGSVNNAQREGTDFRINQRVTYRCNSCYGGGGVITCQGNGQWTQPMPRCDFVTCQNPGGLANGFLRDNNFGCGQTVNYGCNNGYRLEGSPALQCQTNGQWNGSPPRCIPVVQPCPDPGAVSNARRDPQPQPSFQPRSTVTYACDSCYAGGGTITCQSNGQWDGRPDCRPITCNDPAPNGIANGQRQGNTPFYCNSDITFTCNNGYRMQGNNRIVCQSNGQFNGGPPSCVPDIQLCPDPGAVSNARRDPQAQPSFQPRSIVTYACDSCYAGGGTITCQSNGQWDGRPDCRPVTCSDPGSPQNGNRRLGNAPHSCNSVIEYVCNNGYQMEGSARATCQPNGQYSSPVPRCAPILVQCQDPGSVANAVREGTDFRLNSRVTYRCESCYTGTATITCRSNGQWDPRPQCVPVQCPDPGSVDNADRSWDGNTNTGGVATFTCRSGYQVENGNGRVICRCGSWGAMPTCRRIVQCEDPGERPNLLKITDSGYRRNSVVYYTCENGFDMNGASALTCLTNGVWSAPKPVCSPRSASTCGEPPSVQFARNDRDRQGINVGAVITYECPPNYQMVGSSTVRCQSNGRWSAAPRCDPISTSTNCGEPPSVQFARNDRDRQGTNVGAVITYECPPNYQLSGSSTVRCESNGQWSAAPRCDQVQQNPSPCGSARADIVFVLDSSDRVGGQNNFNNILQFVSRTVQQFPVGANNVRVGVVSFASTARNDMYLRQERNVAQDVLGISYMGGPNPSPSEALRVMSNRQFTRNEGDRRDARDIIVLVTTDLFGQEAISLTTEAENLRNQGKQLIIVGITRDPNQVIQLAQIAHPPTCGPAAQLYYFISPDASQLVAVTYESLWRRICNQAASSTCPSPGVLQNGRSSTSTSGLNCNTFEVNTVIGYACQAPYQLQGSAYLTCRNDGRFDGSLPRCEGSGTGTGNNCQGLQDGDNGCQGWVSQDSAPCNIERSYLRENCRLSCCRAEVNNPGPAPVPAPTPPPTVPSTPPQCRNLADSDPIMCLVRTMADNNCREQSVADNCRLSCCRYRFQSSGNSNCQGRQDRNQACEGWVNQDSVQCNTERYLQENCQLSCCRAGVNIP